MYALRRSENAPDWYTYTNIHTYAIKLHPIIYTHEITAF